MILIVFSIDEQCIVNLKKKTTQIFYAKLFMQTNKLHISQDLVNKRHQDEKHFRQLYFYHNCIFLKTIVLPTSTLPMCDV